MIDTNKQKDSLEEEKKVLIEQLSSVGMVNPDDPNDWIPTPDKGDGEHAEQGDRTEQMEELGERVAEQGVLEERLKNVLGALKRIENGTYGKCAEGGDHEIEEGRLEANPAAATCMAHTN